MNRISKVSIYHPSVPARDEFSKSMKNIRVALLINTKTAIIGAKGKIAVYDMANRQKLGDINPDSGLLFKMENNKIMAGNHVFDASEIRLVPSKNDYLTVNQRKYRGQLTVLSEANGVITVVNILGLDDYLQGVVPNEVMARWPMEVLRAQAVVARTFAVYKMSGSKLAPYDLESSVNSQVYRGLDSEQESTNQAVRTTAGLIVAHAGRVISAFYHANCGGRTSDVKNVWGSNIAYLEGVKCGFCNEGAHFNWTFQIKINELENVAKRHNHPVNGLGKIILSGRDSSNRVENVVFDSRQGKYEMKSAAFRMMVGSDKIRSTNFYTEQKGADITFIGRGWGHGVGMCQQGAMGMAASGYNYQAIIRYYYPGTDIVKMEQ